MKGRYLLSLVNKSLIERNIFADKSSVVVAWLLLIGVEKKSFSLREVAEETRASLGCVHRVFETLVMNGQLATSGLRTKKTFYLKNPSGLLADWLDKYSIVKKCPQFTYATGFSNRNQLLDALFNSGLQKEVPFALHSSAEVFGCKNTNLQSLELYLIKPDLKSKLEKVLKLTPKERGYDVLLLAPYYKTMLQDACEYDSSLAYTAPALLTFLDLYHFPLRGIEQAEYMATKIPELKRIYKRDSKNG